jgi:glyoxylase-like metal-dependent hydrolase (beta-lactamase superfamily II)
MARSRCVATLSLVLALACGGDGGDGGGSSETGGASTSTTTTASTGEASSEAGTSGSTSVAESTGDVDESGSSDGSGTTGGGSVCAGELPAMWPDGTDCAAPSMFVHAYDDDTVILRQSLCTSFEGPFLFMLFGADRVLLLDTGDGGIPVDDVVYGIVEDWLAANGRAAIELLVVNTHGHGDHVAGNPLFVGQPDTTVVGYTVQAVSDFFGIGNWPEQTVEVDLGGRVLDLVPIPGHQSAHVALFDRQTGLLLTGDTLYPGRLYIEDFPTYVASIHRLVDFVGAREVCRVLGTHIEMTNTPGMDFPFGADEHPDEHPLELGIEHLLELRDAVDAMGDSPQIEVHDDFIVYPL